MCCLFQSEFGPVAIIPCRGLENALANSSRILPLITTAHDPAAANAQYWPEIYVNQSLYDPAKNPDGESPGPKSLAGNVSSLDPQMFSTVNEFVDSHLYFKTLGQSLPLDVALQLDAWATAAFHSLAQPRQSGQGCAHSSRVGVG